LNHTRFDDRHSNHSLTDGKFSYSGKVLISTLSAALLPGGRMIRFSATFPDSTQIIFRNSSSPKSGIRSALSTHGFQTTVESEPDFSIRMRRCKLES